MAACFENDPDGCLVFAESAGKLSGTITLPALGNNGDIECVGSGVGLRTAIGRGFDAGATGVVIIDDGALDATNPGHIASADPVLTYGAASTRAFIENTSAVPAQVQCFSEGFMDIETNFIDTTARQSKLEVEGEIRFITHSTAQANPFGDFTEGVDWDWEGKTVMHGQYGSDLSSGELDTFQVSHVVRKVVSQGDFAYLEFRFVVDQIGGSGKGLVVRYSLTNTIFLYAMREIT